MNYEVFITYNQDESGDRISQQILNESYVVYSNRIVLNQIPDDYYGVRISDGGEQLVEVKNQTKQLAINEYRVDYSNGVIFFNTNKEGASVLVEEYYGIGFISYPADRIYSKTDGVSVTQSLGDIISTQVREFIFSKDEPPTDTSQYKEGTVWFIYQE